MEHLAVILRALLSNLSFFFFFEAAVLLALLLLLALALGSL
jgi:hypothetical protein